jgi:hypothetical protein
MRSTSSFHTSCTLLTSACQWSSSTESQEEYVLLPLLLLAGWRLLPILSLTISPDCLLQMPGHQDLRTAQNAAWLAGCYHAKKKVFMYVDRSDLQKSSSLGFSLAYAARPFVRSQTPTFNARPAVDACLDAARRGVVVTIYMGLGELLFLFCCASRSRAWTEAYSAGRSRLD